MFEHLVEFSEDTAGALQLTGSITRHMLEDIGMNMSICLHSTLVIN